MRTLTDLTDPSAVQAAIDEFDAIGREAFLRKYGFGRALTYFLVHEGKRYDSKAIAGAAYAYQYPARGAGRREEFGGGDSHAAHRLRILGFTVHGATPATSDPEERPRF